MILQNDDGNLELSTMVQSLSSIGSFSTKQTDQPDWLGLQLL